MEASYILVLLGCLFAGQVSLVQGQVPAQCDTNILDGCMANVSDVQNRFWTNSINSDNIDSACSNFSDAVTCVQTTANCQDSDYPVLAKWLGVKNSIKYRCEDGRADYLKVQPCIGNGTFAHRYSLNCMAYNAPVVSNMSADATCIQYYEQVNCGEDTARSVCGDEGAKFIRKAMTTAYDPQVMSRAPSCTGKCNATALGMCLGQFENYTSGFFDSILNETTIEEGCSSYTRTSDCVKSNTECSDVDTVTKTRWLGIKNTVAHICGDGKQAYLRNQQCMSNNTYLAERNKCNGPIDMTDATTGCKAMNDWIACIKTAATNTCGTEAADLMATLAPRYLGPGYQAQYPSCIIPGSLAGGSAALLLNAFLILAAFTAHFV